MGDGEWKMVDVKLFTRKQFKKSLFLNFVYRKVFPLGRFRGALFTLARSSSGLGHRPLKAGITVSNTVRATNKLSGLYVRFSYFSNYEKI